MSQELPTPINRVCYKVKEWTAVHHGEYSSWTSKHEKREVVGLEQAQVATSQVYGTNEHYPVLDLDIPHTLVPSSTPGHSHLYIDTPISWRRYKRMLRAMAKAGVLEDGYVKASIKRGHTAVRLPWIKK